MQARITSYNASLAAGSTIINIRESTRRNGGQHAHQVATESNRQSQAHASSLKPQNSTPLQVHIGSTPPHICGQVSSNLATAHLQPDEVGIGSTPPHICGQVSSNLATAHLQPDEVGIGSTPPHICGQVSSNLATAHLQPDEVGIGSTPSHICGQVSSNLATAHLQPDEVGINTAASRTCPFIKCNHTSMTTTSSQSMPIHNLLTSSQQHGFSPANSTVGILNLQSGEESDSESSRGGPPPQVFGARPGAANPPGRRPRATPTLGEIVPTSLPELPKPYRTSGESQKPIC